MGEFEDTLGRILGDPSALAQIARLAQSLGSPAPPDGDSPPEKRPPGPPAPADGTVRPPEPTAPTGGPPRPADGAAPPVKQGNPISSGGFPGLAEGLDGVSGLPGMPVLPGLSGLAGLSDAPRLRKLLPLLLEGRQNSEARRFLYALRPYLSPRRRENVERALQLARLIRVGRRFLAEDGGPGPSGRAAGTGGGTEGV